MRFLTLLIVLYNAKIKEYDGHEGHARAFFQRARFFNNSTKLLSPVSFKRVSGFLDGRPDSVFCCVSFDG